MRKHRKKIKTSLAQILGSNLSLTMLLSSLAYSEALYAQNYPFDLPAQPLPQAVQQLARQAQIEIGYVGDILEHKQAPALKGQLSVEQALAQLLQGSKLSFKKQGEIWMIVHNAQSPSNQSSAIPKPYN
jgi:hypothetical protein